MIQVLREAKRTPADVQVRLTRAGGINRYGEPNFRAVWGWSRLTWIGGRWEDRDARHGGLIREVVELRKVPKYTPFDRWHIERWMPPEAYGSPAEWYARTLEIEGGQAIAALGPYPERGEYEHCFTLAGPRGEFVQLTPTVAEYVARAIEFSRGLPRSWRRKALDNREANREREYDSWAYDVLDDAAPALHGLPFATVVS